MLRMLDTDICSYLIRGRSQRIEDRLATVAPNELCISVVTRAELLYGLRRLPASHRLHRSVQRFLRMVRSLPWDDDAAQFYAQIRYQLVAAGKPIGELDMMIAAHALALGATLVTNNTRHYQRIAQPLDIENWSD
ncbi:MAG TPA: type II toxin-antitoxin system VapC family toxin [Acidobacteriaceae bacterium]|nr:type II toxin-antitoxin system VapC family toxin [Acidobacteriaceae bacterium]